MGTTNLTSPPAQLDCAPAGSIARDLGEQYEKLYAHEIITVDDPTDTEHAVPVLLAPVGKNVLSLKRFLDEYRDRPERRQGTAKLQTLDSFVDHVNRFKDGDSAIFANKDRAQPRLTAVLDYHESVAEAGEGIAEPRFGVHRSVYTCPLSDEWKAWTAKHGQPMTQADFAAFLEDRISDVVTNNGDETLAEFAEMVGGAWAGPSTLLALARGLQVNVESTVKEAITLSTGEIAINYTETHKDGAGQPIKVPNLFAIAVPVFYGGDAYRIPVRLRYRVQQGRLTWSFHLYRADRAFDDAFLDVCSKAGEQTSLPVFVGEPEA